MLNVFVNMYGHRKHVGILRENGNRVFFQYVPEFLATGISLSPFQLPLKNNVFEDAERTFDGLFGLFNDSLPDGWGVLLLDRWLRRSGLGWNEITPLKRLSLIGKNPMGALEYEPVEETGEWTREIALDSLSGEITTILSGEDSAFLDELRSLNGSSGGARPKIFAWVSPDFKHIVHGGLQAPFPGYTQWMIKYPESGAARNAGRMEYLYSVLARKAGIIMPETHLFPSAVCDGYFGVRRFDRTDNGEKIHVHTVCGLLHASHRYPSIDYENLLKLTQILTKDKTQVLEMVRRMIFNVAFQNRDDHSKNFSFLMTPSGQWQLTPAYDLTPSSGLNGEHTATVNGKGRNITREDLVEAAQFVGISPKETLQIADVVYACREELARQA